MSKVGLAIFASGRGSNAKAILDQEADHNYRVKLLVVSNKNAQAIQLAKEYNRPFVVLGKDTFQYTKEILTVLDQHQASLIVLAGFLWKIPAYLIQAYPEKIVNIHPSLLPEYGGKGMYGMRVHEAVVKNREKYSGITIHLVNEEYDKGRVLFQEKIALDEEETGESLAKRILALEHYHFPKVIGDLSKH